MSATNQCGYCIASHTASARKAGMTDAMFAELIAVTGMANETNRLASGYQVEIDDRFQLLPLNRDCKKRLANLIPRGRLPRRSKLP